MTLRNWLLLTVMAVFALPALAQYEMPREVSVDDGGGGGDWSGGGSYGLGRYLENPCTAVEDWVWVNYDVSVQQEGWDLSGSARVVTDEQTSMDGSYAAGGSSTSDVVYSMQAYTLRKYHKVNTYDAFHVVTVIDVDPASQQTTLSVETACGDGLPDSAQ